MLSLDELNYDLAVLADEAREAVVEIQYDAMMMEMWANNPRFYGPDYEESEWD